MVTLDHRSLIALGSQIRMWRRRTDRRSAVNGYALNRRFEYMTQSDLAEACGVSITLIQQVESGRYKHITQDLMSILARGLRLNKEQEQYLHFYVGSYRPSHNFAIQEVSDQTRAIVERLSPSPVVVSNLVFDIIYWNRTAELMMGPFGNEEGGYGNVAESMFLDPRMRKCWANWEEPAGMLVSGMKMTYSQLVSQGAEAEFYSLVQYLSSQSDEFALWWDEKDPEINPVYEKEFIHEKYGSLKINQNVQQVVGDSPVMIISFTARDHKTEEILYHMMHGASA